MVLEALKDDRVVAGTRCLGCRYDLGGLASGGNCPECSLPIADTLNWQWLGLEPGSHRRRLATASTMVWVAGAVLLMVLVCFALSAIVLAMDDALVRLPGSAIAWMVLALVGVELSVGWWFLSSPPPRSRLAGGRDGLEVSRALPRLFALASTVVSFGGIFVLMTRTIGDSGDSSAAMEWLNGPGGRLMLSIAFVAVLLGTLLTHMTGVWYLARLASRLDARCSQYEPGTLALSLRQTGWIPVYTVAVGTLAVALYPVAILMVGFFGIVPIAWAVITVVLVPSALLFALARSVWLVASFGGSVRSLLPVPGAPPIAVHSDGLAPRAGSGREAGVP